MLLKNGGGDKRGFETVDAPAPERRAKRTERLAFRFAVVRKRAEVSLHLFGRAVRLDEFALARRERCPPRFRVHKIFSL